jgi:two-component system response regulator FixJ
LDLHLGTGPDGIEVLEELRRRGDGTPVVMVTAHGDVAAAVRAMRAGAADFVEKPYSRDRLLAAVADARARGAFQARAATLLGQLTRREREVLDGLVAGKANKQVAYDMGISPRTVEVHRATAMVKLQARSFADAVRIVLAQPGVS